MRQRLGAGFRANDAVAGASGLRGRHCDPRARRSGRNGNASGMPFVPGDRLQTTRGRIEVLFSDGTALAIDEYTTVELQDGALLRMMAGRVQLTVVGVNDPANASRYQIDTPSASAATDGPGEYRVAMMNGRGAPETELAVFRGYATLATDVGSTAARAGERILARDAISRPASRCRSTPRGSTRSIAGRARGAMREPARVDQIPAARSRTPTAARSIAMARGVTRRRMECVVSHRDAGMAALLLRLLVSGPRRTAGHGLGTTRGDGQRIITAAGDSPPAGGSGFPGQPGDRPGSRGRRRRDMSAGVRSATAEAGGFSFGVSFGNPWGWVVVSRRTSATGTGIPFITTRFRRPRFHIGRRLSSRRARRLHRQPPCRDHGHPEACQRAAPASAPARATRSGPPAGDGSRRRFSVTPNQPELGGARAVRAASRQQPSVRPRAATAFDRMPGRETDRLPRNDNRYVPDTRTLGGRPPAPSRAERHQPRLPRTTVRLAASPRWYPPVNDDATAQEQQSTVARRCRRAYRAAPVQRAQPFDRFRRTAPPGGAQPRRPAGAPPPCPPFSRPG